MRNELAELLDEVRVEAPRRRYEVDDVVAAGRRLRRRRTAGWLAGAALAVSAAVAVPVVATWPQAQRSPVTPAASGTAPRAERPISFDEALQGFSVPGFRVTGPAAVSLAYERAYILRSADKEFDPVGWVTRYRTGYFDPVHFRGGEQVRIAGRPGWYQDGELAWQYADNAWATATLQPGTRADLLRLGEGMVLNRARPAKFPVKLGRVPSGYRLAEVNNQTGAGSATEAEPQVWAMWFLPGSLNGRPLHAPIFSALVGAEQETKPALRVTLRPILTPYKDNLGAPWCEGATCVHPLANGFELTATSKQIKPAELRAMLLAATVADPTKPASWPTVDDAVPSSARFTD